MHSAISLLTIALAGSASAWPKINIASGTGGSAPSGVSHPKGTGSTGAFPQPTGSGLRGPTGSGSGRYPSTSSTVPAKTTTIIVSGFGPTTTSTNTGTTTITETITSYIPCSSVIATQGQSTFYSTSLTVSYFTTTKTAVTTDYTVFCPATSGASIQSNGPVLPTMPASPSNLNPSESGIPIQNENVSICSTATVTVTATTTVTVGSGSQETSSISGPSSGSSSSSSSSSDSSSNLGSGLVSGQPPFQSPSGKAAFPLPNGVSSFVGPSNSLYRPTGTGAPHASGTGAFHHLGTGATYSSGSGARPSASVMATRYAL